jgi:hypothetical protein
MRSVEQSTRFAKAKRRLPPRGQLALDEEVKQLVENPLVGEVKVGTLKGVRVLKFKLGPLQLLMAYTMNYHAARCDGIVFCSGQSFRA